MKKLKKKSIGFGKKKNFGSNTNTEIGPWFWFLIPKPGLGCTLLMNTIFSLDSKRIKSKMRTFATQSCFLFIQLSKTQKKKYRIVCLIFCIHLVGIIQQREKIAIYKNAASCKSFRLQIHKCQLAFLCKSWSKQFSNFFCKFPMIFSNLNSNCSNSLDMSPPGTS